MAACPVKKVNCMRFVFRSAALALGAALVSAPLVAQTAKPAAPAASAATPTAPQAITPKMGADGAKPWASGCKGTGEQEICDAVQSLIDEANGKEVIRVAIARQKATGKTGLLVKVPLGVRLDTGALMQVDGDQAKAIDKIIFSRCLPEGCIGEKPLAATDIDHLKKAKKLELVFLDLEGKPIVINVVPTGLATALASF
ncbi:invasion protein IalB [Blastomonas natatoria]|uniref:Invasion protein IalB n=2 Tax=Blastomonas natatoria TaxID=34015 RepID=A0A2V3V8G0_9SPHN|nr:invasion protein IalB [Blastomonas natatoria]